MRSSAQRAQERRRALIVTSAMLFVAVGAVIAVFASSLGASHNESRDATLAASEDLRTAKITRDSDGPDCTQQVLDNRTWRVSSQTQPCSNISYDSNGNPIPTGTIHRLDAISKSFGNR